MCFILYSTLTKPVYFIPQKRFVFVCSGDTLKNSIILKGEKIWQELKTWNIQPTEIHQKDLYLLKSSTHIEDLFGQPNVLV